jgi:hypothetical protein
MRHAVFFILCLLLAAEGSAQRRPATRPVHIRRVYKRVGRENVLTAAIPTFVTTSECLGPGVGLAYERFVRKDGKLSVNVPAYLFIVNSFKMGGFHEGDPEIELQGGYAMPALMYHPFGNTHRIDFSFGPALIAGTIHRKESEAGITIINPEKNFQRTDNLIGAMLCLNFTLHSPSAFVFGMHVDVGGIQAGPYKEALVQFGLKLGARF